MRKKELFVDSADVDEIRRVLETGVASGITTNPSLVAKTRPRPYEEAMQEVLDVAGKHGVSKKKDVHVSCEVTVPSSDKEAVLEQAKILGSSLRRPPSVYCFLKIPIRYELLDVVSFLSSSRLARVNVTACVKSEQAVLAAKSGAAVVSFFYRRMLDAGLSFEREVGEFRECVGDDAPLVIAGSIRTSKDAIAAWIQGADVVTAPERVVAEMCQHPKTDESIERFEKEVSDWLTRG